MKARLLLFVAVLFSGAAWSQGKVTGKVTDRASRDGSAFNETLVGRELKRLTF